MAKSKTKYYVVWVGLRPGIYETWADCKAQIANYPNATYKSFKTRQEAEKAYKQPATASIGKKAKAAPRDLSAFKDEIIWESISVDAACSNNPGIMEYRGVVTQTGKEIFRLGPFEEGTNNVGEFLALVHGLALLKKKGKEDIPIYSDSKTAMAWVRNRKAKTTLKQTSKNEAIFQLINRALRWLENNSYKTKIYKWDTERWGEIPADFGRK